MWQAPARRPRKVRLSFLNPLRAWVQTKYRELPWYQECTARERGATWAVDLISANRRTARGQDSCPTWTPMVWIQSSRAKPISTVRRTSQSQRACVSRRRGRQPRRVLRRGNTRSDRAASATQTKARTKTTKRRKWSRGRRRDPHRILHTTEGNPNGIVPRRPVIV